MNTYYSQLFAWISCVILNLHCKIDFKQEHFNATTVSDYIRGYLVRVSQSLAFDVCFIVEPFILFTFHIKLKAPGLQGLRVHKTTLLVRYGRNTILVLSGA